MNVNGERVEEGSYLCGENEDEGACYSETKRAASPEPSCVSVKSDHSKSAFSDGAKRPRLENQPTASPVPSCVSMKSNHSRCDLCDQLLKDPASSNCERSLCSQCISRFWYQSGSSGEPDCLRFRMRSRTQPTFQPLKNIDPMEHEQPVEDILQNVLVTHKASMKSKCEGIRMQQNKSHLNSIHTQLCIVEGDVQGVIEEHEIVRAEKTFRGNTTGIPIHSSDLFRPLVEQGLQPEMKEHHERIGEEEGKFKTVLTKGIAGIGKTVTVQKFVLDWAEGKANQDVDFVFLLPFRELNLIKDENCSLHGLLCDFHPELKELDPKIYNTCKIMFILDGLDESRISLNIATVSPSEIISDVTHQSSVGVLMTSIITGELLPSALIWITSRPTAASQIPSQYVNRMTELQGFSDPQIKKYFNKSIRDPVQAVRVFSQITKAKTLYVMCHIPNFCWISSTVIQQTLNEDTYREIPTTLTEMYIHFMLIQTKMMNIGHQQGKEMILKLAELAFKQLIKGNILFYEEDLRECGIDITKASVYAAVFNEIFKEDQKKVYYFVHLSFQEFFAALFGYHACLEKDYEVVKMFQSSTLMEKNGGFASHFMTSVMYEALTSETGHWDLFLRFLYGISQKSNLELLYHILPYEQTISEGLQQSFQNIRRKRLKNVSPERWINFSYCLTEMKDSFQREAKSLLNAKRNLTEWDCTRIAYTLQTSEGVLDEFDPKKYKTSDEGYRRLIPVVWNCRKALLTNIKLTKQDCEIVISALQSANSVLTELDLSYNDVQDSGVKHLLAGLRSPHCKLETLRLVMCNLTKKSCEYLAPVLQSAALKELDLSQNDLQDSGLSLLSEALKSPNCQLQILSLSGCLVTMEGCASLASALSSNPSLLRQLDLSYNHPGKSGMELLSAKVDDPNYTLKKLNLNHGGVFRLKPGVRKHACELTMDLNTVNSALVLSEDNRKVTYVCPETQLQFNPNHPERSQYTQLLCREGLSGRCYWEAEWSGWKAGIAVAYKGTTREFGSDGNSWCLFAFKKQFFLRHKDKKKVIPGLYSNRVGVYLDWPTGMLSFYSVHSDGSTLSHLHTVQCRFTKPVYAGFFVYEASVSLCHVYEDL